MCTQWVHGHCKSGWSQCSSRTADEPLGRKAAEEAYCGLVREGAIRGKLFLQLDRFGVSPVRWEIRMRPGGCVEWLHDEHGTEPWCWTGETEFVAFWAGLSEQAAAELTGQVLRMPGSGKGGLKPSGDLALSALRRLVERQRRQRHGSKARVAPAVTIAPAGPTMPQLEPRQLKLILPPALPLVRKETQIDFDAKPHTESQQCKVRRIQPSFSDTLHGDSCPCLLPCQSTCSCFFVALGAYSRPS